MVARVAHAEVKLCKYGIGCKRAAWCTFAHSEQDLGKKVVPLPEGKKYREVCSFGVARACAKAECLFIHDEVPCNR